MKIFNSDESQNSESSSNLSLCINPPVTIEERFAYLTKGSLAPNKYLTNLKTSVVTGTNNILIEFLTINLVGILQKKLNETFLFKLKSSIIEENIESFDLVSTQILRNKEFLDTLHKSIVSEVDRNNYIYQFTTETELLAKEFYELFKKKFLNTFQKPETVKFSLNIPRTKNLLDDDQEAIQPTGGLRRSFIFQNEFVKLFCPVLLYKSDLKQEKKAKSSYLFGAIKEGNLLFYF